MLVVIDEANNEASVRYRSRPAGLNSEFVLFVASSRRATSMPSNCRLDHAFAVKPEVSHTCSEVPKSFEPETLQRIELRLQSIAHS